MEYIHIHIHMQTCIWKYHIAETYIHIYRYLIVRALQFIYMHYKVVPQGSFYAWSIFRCANNVQNLSSSTCTTANLGGSLIRLQIICLQHSWCNLMGLYNFIELEVEVMWHKRRRPSPWMMWIFDVVMMMIAPLGWWEPISLQTIPTDVLLDVDVLQCNSSSLSAALYEVGISSYIDKLTKKRMHYLNCHKCYVLTIIFSVARFSV